MKLKRYFQVAVTYIGAIIGAGFASGQELLQFFIVYGASGLTGIIISGLLFILLGISMGLVGYHFQLEDYHNLFYKLGGRVIGLVADLFLTLFLLGSLIVMLAGCKEIFNYLFTWPLNLGLVVTVFIIVGSNYYGLEGIMKLNTLLIPVLIIISLVVVINLTTTADLVEPSFSFKLPIVTSAAVYSGYNLVLGMVILLPLTAKMRRQEVVIGIFAGGLMLGIIAFVIGSILLQYTPEIIASEIPMLEIVYKYQAKLYYVYGIVLWLAMLTTASCNLYGLVTRLEAVCSLTKGRLLLLILVIVLPIVNLRFSKLVELIYPWLGKINLSLMAGLIVSYAGQKVYKGSGDYGGYWL
ncbi:YkvI family membrane protein [Halanaerobaculum tunisiense]